MKSTTAAQIEPLLPVLDQFFPANTVTACESYGCGHINTTYLITTDCGRRYILQRINTAIFRNADQLMENVTMIIDHLQAKTRDPRAVLHLVPTRDCRPYLPMEDGVWRVFDFVEGSICLQLPETPEDFYESAVAFGRFQELLKDFPAEKLHETIPNFHHTPDRYRIFREVLAADPMGGPNRFPRRSISFWPGSRRPGP